MSTASVLLLVVFILVKICLTRKLLTHFFTAGTDEGDILRAGKKDRGPKTAEKTTGKHGNYLRA
jgi:hypothetical protein